jgi:hypothetical protein
MIRKLTHLFDRFITEIGGNLDPRGGCNKTRRALMEFWYNVQLLDDDIYDSVEIRRCMQKIIQEKITKHDLKSEPKFRVYDVWDKTIVEKP